MNGKLSPKREAYNAIARALIYLCAGITVLLLVALIAYIFYRGLGNITWQLLSTQRSALKGTIGILPNILFTLYTIFTALIIVLPLGIVRSWGFSRASSPVPSPLSS